MNSLILVSFLGAASNGTVVTLDRANPLAGILAKALPEIVDEHSDFDMEWNASNKAYIVADGESYLIACSSTYQLGRLPTPRKYSKGCTITKDHLPQGTVPLSFTDFLKLLSGASE